jgi:hypothetical protein
MMKSYAEEWWEWIMGPSMLAEKITRTINDESNIILTMNESLPWNNELRNVIERQESFSNRTMYVIDYSDVNSENRSLDLNLLDMIAGDRPTDDYLPHVESLAQYVTKKGFMDSRVLWIQGIPGKHIKSVISTIKKIKSHGGIFIVENTNWIDVNNRDIPNNYTVIRTDSYISQEDIRLFVHKLCNGKKLPMRVTRYAVSVISSLYEFDVESVSELIDAIPLESQGTIDMIEMIHHNFLDTHVQRRKLWHGQIEALFPMIEEERVEFIEKHRSVLESIMPESDPFGNVLEQAVDMDIGVLYHVLSQHRSHDVVENHVKGREFHRIELLRNMRNRLAHVQACKAEDVSDVLMSKI